MQPERFTRKRRGRETEEQSLYVLLRRLNLIYLPIECNCIRLYSVHVVQFEEKKSGLSL